MKKHLWLSGLAIAPLMAGCSSPTSEVSPKVDGQIRDNLTRQLTPEEISKMGGSPKGQEGSAPAQAPAGKGTKASSPGR